MPLGHKTEQYLALARQAMAELGKRERLRSWRGDLAMLTDAYALKQYSKAKKLPCVTKWAIDRSNSAMLNLALIKST